MMETARTSAPFASLSAAARHLGHALAVLLVLLSIGCALYGFLPLRDALDLRFDRPWLITYAGAALLIALLVWPLRGRILFAIAGLALVGLLAALVVCGGFGKMLLTLAWMTFLSLGLGQSFFRFVTPRLRPSSGERLILAIVTGYGLLSVLTLALACLQVLRLWPVVLVLVGLTLATLRECARVIGQCIQDLRRLCPEWWAQADWHLPAVVLAGIVLCAFGGILWAVAPAIHTDSLNYHLAVPQAYVYHGGIVEVTETVLAYHVHNGEMLFTLGLLLQGQPLPGLFHFLFGLLTAGVILCLGSRLAHPYVGMLAALLFYALPIVTWESGTTYIDLFTTGYALAALHAAVLWWQEREPGWLTLVSLLGGLAVGVKLNALLFFLPVGACVLVSLVLPHEPRPGWKGCLARLILPGAVIAAPWFVLSSFWTGNPIYPLFNTTIEKFLPHVKPAMREGLWGVYGGGRNPSELLRFPWDLTLKSGSFGELALNDFGGLTLLGLPFLLLLPPIRAQRQALLLAFLALASLAISYFITRYFRYMLPVAGVLALLAAINLHGIWLTIAHTRWRPVFTVAAILVGMTWLTLTRWAGLQRNFYLTERYPLGLALGRESQEEFLARTVPQYEAMRYLAKNAGTSRPGVLDLGTFDRLYCGPVVMHDAMQSFLAKQLFFMPAGPVLYEALQKHGIEYLFINHPALNRLGFAFEESALPGVLDHGFLERFARLVHTSKGICVYRLGIQDEESSWKRPLLLKNGGLELRTPGGGLETWTVSGAVVIDDSGAHSHSGRCAVRVTQDALICQRFTVQVDGIYTFSAYLRADQAGQTGWLQYLWLDADMQILSTDVLPVPVRSAWERKEYTLRAPPGACYGQVYGRADPGSEVWVDDLEVVQR